ncbi:MAG TPA: Gfo/Idh/MocA family oxidoreductase [Chthonomonadaceae bacterium]|nr:Gfo/Idh/MocA family oxidoreductase [Chthonomonadaceae bacterium]
MAIRIGLVDHHLNNYHADVFLRLIRAGRAGREAEIVAAWESNPTGDDWCVKNKVRRAASPQDAARDADAVMVLAPDNIDVHPAFCDQVLPLGKPTFVDKYLAPTVAEARTIVAQAEKNRTPLLCCSALRYAEELNELLADAPQPIQAMYSRGMGQWKGYGIHSVSPVVRVMGGGVRRVIDTGVPGDSFVTLDYGDGHRALIEVHACDNGYEVFSWQLGIRVGNSYRITTVKQYEQFYANQMMAVLNFFATSQPDITPQEAISVVAILEGAEKSQAGGGVWVPVEA